MRGAVKLPHTPERRLGGTAHRQAEYACGGPTDAEPTPKGAGPPPFNLTALRSKPSVKWPHCRSLKTPQIHGHSSNLIDIVINFAQDWDEGSIRAGLV